jgi:predicted RNase H-like HicB family nuclease
MITAYIAAALSHATFEFLEDDGEYYGEIPGFSGVWATGPTVDASRDELVEVLEEWLLLRVSLHLPLPTVAGLALKVEGVA